MPRRLPPFAAIRAFEATARHLSMKAAAEELCVTASAISHQIKTLEEYFDTALFDREGGRLSLTLTGAAYQGKLTGLLDGLEASAAEVTAGRQQELRILSTPGFAARWLVPRLGRIPNGDRVRLRVSDGAPDTDFETNDADIVIHWRDAPVPGAVVIPFMQSVRYPAASPELIRREGIREPEDLLRLTLLRDETDDCWPDWFASAGITPDRPLTGPRFSNCEIASTAAERGQGVTLAFDAVLRGTVASGRLQRLFETVTLPMTIYSVACREHRRDEPLIREFFDWILQEAAREDCLPGGPAKPEAPPLRVVGGPRKEAAG